MGRSRNVVLCVFLIAGSVGVLATQAEAANISVTDVGDPTPDGCNVGTCSLREAVDLAEDDSTPDTIILQNATYTLQAATGGALAVTTPITIQGNGATLTTGGAWNDRLFDVSSAGNLTINSLTLTGGDIGAVGADGGAIQNAGILAVNGSEFSFNKADDLGGAIFSGAGATTTITQTHFEENDAAFGGAFATDGAFSITGSTFKNNGEATDGGAVHANLTDPLTGEITATTFDNNAAQRNGGGLFNSGTGDVTVNDSFFTLNDALGSTSDGDGGAIYAGINAITFITRTTIDDNEAFHRGAGVMNFGVMDITHSAVTNNLVSGEATLFADGGGIANASNGDLLIENTTISGNKAEDFGGGIRSDATTTIVNSTITSNRANFSSIDSTGVGGGIAGGAGTTTVEGSIVFGNFNDGSPAVPRKDCTSIVTSAGGNVFGSDSQCPVGNPTDSTDDPLLSALAANGGPTSTHAIGAGSAVDRNDSDDSCGGTDQRGAPRPVEENCDSGAYERVFCGPLLVNVLGTAGNDIITATDGVDGVLALGGNDTISALGGNDAVCAGTGNDKVNGGTGNDKVFGEDGADTLRGQAGNDVLKGGPQRDKCIGGTGRDKLRACEVARP